MKDVILSIGLLLCGMPHLDAQTDSTWIEILPVVSRYNQQLVGLTQLRDTYYSAGWTYVDTPLIGAGYNRAVQILKINIEGRLEKSVFVPYNGLSNSIAPVNPILSTLDGNLAVAFTQIDRSSTNSWHYSYSTLVKYNANLDTIWQQRYDLGRKVYIESFIATQDGGFALCGWIYSEYVNETNHNALLIKTDSMGNMQWMREYGDHRSYNEVALRVVEDINGYMLSGRRSWGWEDGWVIQTDHEGRQVLYWQFGNFYDDDGGVSISSSYDNGIIMRGLDRDAPINTPGWGPYYIKRMIFNGQRTPQTHWTLWLNNQVAVAPRNFRSLSDGSILVTGDRTDRGNGRQYAIALKISRNGVPLWERWYDLPGYVIPTFIDGIETVDGGLLLCGYTRKNSHLPSYDQYFLVKTDSEGCVEPDCINRWGATSLDPAAAPAALRIWPQPCRGQLNVENLYPKAAYTLSDMQGRALRSGQWPQPGPQQIDTGGLPPGVYLLEVQGSGRRAQIKVLVR